MAFTLPDLPYAHDALKPHMSAETLEFHHDKHHLAYVNNGNAALKGTEWEGKPLEEIVKGSFGKNPAVFNNAGQHYNHTHFWKWMKPGGSKIPGEIEKALKDSFGSIEKAKEDFIQGGVTQFGSGWSWLAVKDGKVQVMKTPNGENPLVHGASRSSASTCGSTPITSTIAIAGPTISRRGSITSSIGNMSPSCSARSNFRLAPPASQPEGVCPSVGQIQRLLLADIDVRTHPSTDHR